MISARSAEGKTGGTARSNDFLRHQDKEKVQSCLTGREPSLPVFLWSLMIVFVQAAPAIEYNLLYSKEIIMTLDEVIFELYRLAETKKWNSTASDEALAVAIEGMEQIWSLRLADRKKNAKPNGARKQPRLWS